MYIGRDTLTFSLIERALAVAGFKLSQMEPIVQVINFTRSLDSDFGPIMVKDGFGNPGVKRISQSKRRKKARR